MAAGLLLGVASAAMGVQSAVCRSVGAPSTTYLTGAVTGAVLHAVSGHGRDRVGLVCLQVGALLAAALGTALLILWVLGLIYSRRAN